MVFIVVVGGLLLSFGALLTITSIEPTSMGATWDEIKYAFRVMAGKPRFWIGICCTVIGLIMTLGTMSMLIW